MSKLFCFPRKMIPRDYPYYFYFTKIEYVIILSYLFRRSDQDSLGILGTLTRLELEFLNDSFILILGF